MFNAEITPAILMERGASCLPGLIGIEIVKVAPEELVGRLAIRTELIAPNGFLHAASVIALADTMAGYGTMAHLPAGARGFTTIELKSNFIGTARDGAIVCVATPAHLGRTTQVWDAEVKTEGSDRKIALFRCTQMILK
jgi:1,4-dihydroxy-2-naphthoyl-CoA hydrolase